MLLDNKKAAKKGYRQHPEGIFKGKLVEVITHNKATGEQFSLREDNGTVKKRICLVFQTEATYQDEEGVTRNETIWDWHNIPESFENDASNLVKRLSGLGLNFAGETKVDTDDWLGLDGKLTIDYNKEKDRSKILAAKKLDGDAPFEGADYEPYNEVG